jgi:hypothetical protein
VKAWVFETQMESIGFECRFYVDDFILLSAHTIKVPREDPVRATLPWKAMLAILRSSGVHPIAFTDLNPLPIVHNLK